MDAAAPAVQRWPSIDRLVALLTQHDFRIGASEAIDAARLLRRLAEREPGRSGADGLGELASRLGPLLCKSREEQERFPALFDEWSRLPPLTPDTAAGAGPQAVAAGTAADTGGGVADPADTPAPPRRSRWRTVLAMLVLAALLALAWRAWQQGRDGAAPAPTAPTRAEDKASAASAARLPAAPASAPAARQPASAAAPDLPPLDGYVAQTRQQHGLRAGVGWAFGLASLLVLALWAVPAGAPMLGRTRRSSHAVMLDDSALRHEAQRIVPPIAPGTSDRLERHLPGPAVWRDRLQRRPPIDVPRTVQATLRRLGVLQLRHGTARLRPSYLLLIDAKDEADPRGRLFYRWAERLHRAGIEVQIRLFRLDAQGRAVTRRPTGIGWRLDGRDGEPLDRLGTPPIGQRLVIVSDGLPLLSDDGSAWRAWVPQARLQRWGQRVLFTPVEPRHWGPREDRLASSRAGLLVLPLDEPALNAWSALLATGALPRFALSRPQRYPQILRDLDDEQRVLDDARALPELPELLAQLKFYLGANGYYWLAACAVPPLLRWDLTLLLGEHYLRQLQVREADLPAFIAQSYARLATLPWLRHDHMPDWLRLALLDSLAPEVQDEVRRVARGLLGKLVPAGPGAAALPLELPPGALGDAPRRAPAPAGGAADGAAAGSDDVLYLGFLAGRTPRQLMLAAPQEWGGHVALKARPGLWGDRLRAWRDRLLFRHGLALLGAAPALRRAARIGTVLLAAALVLELGWGTRPDAPAPLAALHLRQPVAALLPHGHPVVDLDFSPDGALALSASADGTLQLIDTASGLPTGRTMHYPGRLRRALFSPDGRSVLALGGGPLLRWDTSGRPLPGEGLWARSHAAYLGPDATSDFDPVSPDGRSLVLASPGTAAALYDVASGDQRPAADRSEPGVANPLFDRIASFGASGRRGVTTAAAGQVRLWAAEDGRILRVLQPFAAGDLPPAVRRPDAATPEAGARSTPAGDDQRAPSAKEAKARGPTTVRQQPDAAVATAADTTPAASAASAASAAPPPVARDAGVTRQAQINADDRRVLAVDEHGNVRLWDADSGRPLALLVADGGREVQARFSPDGRLVATATGDTLRLWRADTGAPLPSATGAALAAMQHPSSGDAPTVQRLRFSPDGRQLGSADNHGQVWLWDTATGQAIGAPLRMAGIVSALAFSPDGARLITADSVGEARLWRAGTPVAQPAPGLARDAAPASASRAEVAALSPDGRRVAWWQADGRLRRWQVGQPVADLPSPPPPAAPGEPPSWLSFTDDGALLVGQAGNTVQVWQASDGALRHTLTGCRQDQAPTLSPDSLLLACLGSSAFSNTVRLLDLAGQTLPTDLTAGDQRLSALQFSADSGTLRGLSSDGLVSWSVAVPQRVGPPTLQRLADPVLAASWVSAVQLTALVDATGRLDLLDADGKRVSRFDLGRFPWYSFSPDGQVIAALDGGTPVLWRTVDGVRLGAAPGADAARQPAPRNAWPVPSFRFSRDSQRLLLTAADGTLTLWDTPSGRRIAGPLATGSSQVAADLSADGGQVLALAGDGARSLLWDFADTASPAPQALGRLASADAVWMACGAALAGIAVLLAWRQARQRGRWWAGEAAA